MSGLRRPGWFEADGTGFWRGLALAPLGVVAWLYALGAWSHRWLFASGLRRPARLPCRVVSVGNLVVGGSGKTPIAACIAAQLRRRGYRAALASRGYGRRGREPVRVVSDGRFVRARVHEVGDEPLLLAAHAPGVPVLVGRDRAVAGWRAVAAFGIDVLVLDDGFQHHRVARDVDLVAFDGVGGLGNRRCLPRGPLREPLGALRRADGVIVVDGPLGEDDARRIRARVPTGPWFEARRRAVGMRALAGGPLSGTDSLAGAEVGLVCGIAQPAAFRRGVEALGARVVAERAYADHHVYRPADLAGLESQASLWLTTEKDAVKILPAWVGELDLRVLVIELELADAEAFFDWLESRLRAAPR